MPVTTFTFGENDSNIGKRTTRFKGETGRTYLVSFVSFTDYNEDGTPSEDAKPAFAAVSRIYQAGVGNIIVDDTNRSAMEALLKKEARQYVGTVLCVWPTDEDGDLDVNSFKAGKGWKVMPWILSATRYPDIARCHKKFPLPKHDLSMTCSDGQYQSFTLVSDPKCCLRMYLDSSNEAFQNIGKQIVAKGRKIFDNIGREFGRELTIDEVREALGEEVSSPTGSTSSEQMEGSISSEKMESVLDDLDI